jgi:hypothetical protein
MRRLTVVPWCCAAVVVGVFGAGVAGAGAGPSAPGHDVAKTTIGPAPTGPAATEPLPTVPVPTVPVPTVGIPTVPVPTVPVPTVPDTSARVPTTEAAGLSPEALAIALPVFGLDAARLQCLIAAQPPLSADDDQAIAALQGCAIPLMPILRGMVAVTQASNSYVNPTATTVALPPVPGIDALATEDVFYLGFMLLVDETQASCLVTGLAGATSEDDSTAVAIFQRCQLSIAFTLNMLTIALAGSYIVDPTATTLPSATIPIATTPAAVSVVPTTLSIAPDDPIVDEFQQLLLEQEGITLDDEQAACLLSHIGSGGDIDTEDIGALLALLDSCGITLTDLLPGGTTAFAAG